MRSWDYLSIPPWLMTLLNTKSIRSSSRGLSGRTAGKKSLSPPVTRFYMQDDVLYRELRGQSIAARPYAEDGVIVAGELVRFLMNDAGDVWAAASEIRIEQKLV